MKPYLIIKRLIDLITALVLLMIASPFFFTVAVWIKIVDKESILFCQPRPGKHGKIFTIYKFKTMRTQTHSTDGQPLTDMERMTKIGKFLRAASIDELPQLINIIKGEMSFIGPRPLLVRYLEHYSDFQNRRHEVTPGISGWAQVNGRNAASWDERLKLDVWYVDNICFLLDIKILIKTIVNVFLRTGVNQSDNETMTFFDE